MKIFSLSSKLHHCRIKVQLTLVTEKGLQDAWHVIKHLFLSLE